MAWCGTALVWYGIAMIWNKTGFYGVMYGMVLNALVCREDPPETTHLTYDRECYPHAMDIVRHELVRQGVVRDGMGWDGMGAG